MAIQPVELEKFYRLIDHVAMVMASISPLSSTDSHGDVDKIATRVILWSY